MDKIPDSFQGRLLKIVSFSSLIKVYSVSAPPTEESSTKLLTSDYFIKTTTKITSYQKTPTKVQLTSYRPLSATSLDLMKALILKVQNWHDSITEVEIVKEVKIPAKDMIQLHPKNSINELEIAKEVEIRAKEVYQSHPKDPITEVEIAKNK